MLSANFVVVILGQRFQILYNRYMSTGTKKQPVVFAFIDGNNLKYGVSNDIIDKRTGKINYEGWELDYRKFRLYLKNKYTVSKAYLFIGQVPGNETLYSALQEMGYILVFKPTISYVHEGM